MKTKFTLAACAIALAAGVSQPALSQDGPVVIGFPPASDFLPAIVAGEIGCYEKKGFSAELTKIPVVTNIPPALLSGSMQIGMTTATTLLPAVENGLGLVAVAGSSKMVPGNEGISLVTQPDFAAADAKAVEGKKVGVPGIMSVGDLIFRKYLKDNGTDLSKVDFIETPFPRMAELMKSGTVDAVLAAEPLRTGLVKGGLGQRAPFEYYSAVTGDAILTFWMSTNDWAKENKEIIAGFKACLDEAIAYIKDNKEKALEIEKANLNFNTGLTTEWTSDVTADQLKIYADIAREFDLLRTDLDTGEAVFQP